MGLVLAWMAGEAIVTWRVWKGQHRPPMPGELLAVSGVYLVAGVIHSAPQGAFLGSALGWGMTLAAFLNVAPQLTGGTTTAPAKTSVKEAA